MTLALEHKIIPPNVNFTRPNPKIPFEKCKLKVPTEPTPWPSEKKELVGVNSFGIGGSNAHVLLESAASYGISRPRIENGNEVDEQLLPRLLYFSAKHPDALKRVVEDHQSYLLRHSGSLDDMSYSLAVKREVLTHRAFTISNGEDQWETSVSFRPGDKAPPRKVFVFSGQGAQYAQMGKSLITNVPMFHDCISGLDKALQDCADPPTWSLLDEILRPKKSSRLSEAEFSQPCTTAIQIALVRLLCSYGIRPDAVVGHSSGEIAAAYAAGALSSSEAIIIAYQRGRVVAMYGDAEKGGMAAIGLGSEMTTQFLKPGVLIGCENSPDSVTLTGDKDVLHDVLEDIRTAHPGVLARALHVDRAYHSHHMAAIADQYLASLPNNIQSKKPTIPFYSSVHCKRITESGQLDPEYWVQNLVSPVRFSTAVSNLCHSLFVSKLFVEIGPHSALAGPIRQILRSQSSNDDYITSLARGGDAHTSLLKCVGEMWLRNIGLDADATVPRGNFLTDLPLYPWHYEEALWHESRLSKEWRLRTYPHHDILGSRIIESADNSPSWRNILRLDVVSWIKEHEVGGEIVFPGVGYLCMAGEAIRQLSGALDFSARQIHIQNALVMAQGADVEVITQLERAPLTSTLDSEWYNFTIYSLNQGTWIKHIFGQVRGGSEYPKECIPLEHLPRVLSRRAWYRKMRQEGLAYGARFMGLRDMTADPNQKRIVALLDNDIRDGESHYAVHPVTMDCWIQAMVPAAFHGLTRRSQTLGIPTYIEELYVKPPTGEMMLQTTADEIPKASLSGNTVIISNGEVVGEMKGLQLSSIGNYENDEKADPCAAVELEWKRDVNLLDAAKLMAPAVDRTQLHRKLDEFAALCMIDASNDLKAITPHLDHLAKFQTWLADFVAHIPTGGYNGLDGGSDLASLNDDERRTRIDALYVKLKTTDAGAAATAIRRISQNATGILIGEVDELALLLEDDVLHGVYNFMQNTDYAELIELIAHHKPNLRILEIGAGTGGTTATLLPLLESSYGERMFLNYTYTDVSAGFFMAAKERFAQYAGIDYQVLDVSQNPMDQGFEEGSYDLVVACNVLHATPNLTETLRNVRKLLHPQGRLLLQELDPSTKWINFVMGVLPGWWLGEADGRPLEPYVPSIRWDKDLRAAGFGGVEAVAYDGYLINNIISRPAYDSKTQKRISLLHNENQAADLERSIQVLQARGFVVDLCTLSSIPAADQDILSILDLAGPFIHEMDSSNFDSLTKFVSSINNSGLLWVTGACQVNCTDPRYSMILGLARVLRTEMSLEMAVLELDTFEDQALFLVPNVLNQFMNRLPEPDVKPTSEWAIVNGDVLTSRYHYINVKNELQAVTHKSTPKKLEQHRPGMTDTLYWKSITDDIIPAAGELVIDVRAVGLNFKDVLIASGVIVEKSSIGRGFGYEAAGVVTSVASDVSTFKVGDRVIVSASGTLASSTAANHHLCAAMPDSMSFEEGATMSAVYCTAICGLINSAQLKQGEVCSLTDVDGKVVLTSEQSVLIHAASGGVGIAAIHIAKMLGAEVSQLACKQELRLIISHKRYIAQWEAHPKLSSYSKHSAYQQNEYSTLATRISCPQ